MITIDHPNSPKVTSFTVVSLDRDGNFLPWTSTYNCLKGIFMVTGSLSSSPGVIRCSTQLKGNRREDTERKLCISLHLLQAGKVSTCFHRPGGWSLSHVESKNQGAKPNSWTQTSCCWHYSVVSHDVPGGLISPLLAIPSPKRCNGTWCHPPFSISQYSSSRGWMNPIHYGKMGGNLCLLDVL